MARGISVFFILFLVLTHSAKAQSKAESGILDARQWNFEGARLPLKGQWIFFKNKLLSQQECDSQHGEISIYPAIWTNAGGPGLGYGTYYLKIVVPDTTMMFALEIPQLYNSCTVFVEGVRVASAGNVATTQEETIPKWMYQTVSFHHAKDTLRLILQIANFHHYKGGASESLYLGSPSRIIKHKLWAFGSNIAEIVLLFAMGLVFLIFYLLYRDKKVILYFSLLCITWSIRATFSNLYPVTYFYPSFNWTALVKIEYISLYGGVVWSMLFLHALFQNIKNKIVMYVLVGINVLFTLFTLFTPPLIFSQWINVYLTVAALTVLYGSFIVIRAMLDEQVGALFLLITLLFGALVFGYDIIAYGSSSYNLVFLHCGYIIIFMLVTIALLLHLGIVKGYTKFNNMLTYNDMVGGGKK